MGQFLPTTCLVNKVVLAHSPIDLLMYYLWPLYVASFTWQIWAVVAETIWLAKPKILTIWLFF